MSTATEAFAPRTAILDRSERAQRAVSTFRKMQPTLSSFARALTKRTDVKVVMDTGSPRTDGSNIYYRPPITLGDPTPHQRPLCEKRGQDKILLCPACAAREAVLVVIYHEIAHICYDTFATPSDEQRKEIVAHAIREAGGKRAESIARRIQEAPYYKKGGYLGLASLVSEYLPIIVNALEDARVNREMFRSRPGTKVMFEAMAADAFGNGVEQQDGEIILWRDYPLNTQAIVGLFAKAADYDYANWFQPVVVAALNDPDLTNLVNRMDTIRSVSGVYELSYPVLDRLRDLGFCQNPEDEPEPEPSDEPADEENDDAGQSDTATDPEGESDGPSDGLDDDADGNSGDGAGDPDDAPEDSTESSGGDDDSGVRDGDDDGPGDDDDADESGEQGEGDIGDEPEAGTGDGGTGEEAGSESSDDGESGDSGSGDVQPGADGSADGEAEDAHSDDTSEGAEGEASTADGADNADGTDGDGDSDSEAPEPDQDADDAPAGGSGEDSDGDPQAPDADPTGTGESGDTASVATPSDDPSGDAEGGSQPGDPGDGAPGEGDIDGQDADDELDTGADQGMGGYDLTDEDLPEYGEPDDAKRALKVFGDHDEKPLSLGEIEDEQAVETAIIQGLYFEKPSENVNGVRVHKAGDVDAEGWDHGHLQQYGIDVRTAGVGSDMEVPESILGPALLRMRVAFGKNQRGDHQANLRSGRIRGRALGRRAWSDDDRLFQKKRLPGKRSYLVVIGIDISGSTVGVNLKLAKRAAMAQAELCARMGIDFAVYAHTAVRVQGKPGLSLEMYEIKAAGAPWSTKAKDALDQIAPVAENLDGHSIEFYRKRLDESTATDKIIMYYTDGKMPAANHDEELEILRREIATCKQKGYLLMGVGIRTDSPIRHGLDTVKVDDDEDMVKVVKHLEKKLT